VYECAFFVNNTADCSVGQVRKRQPGTSDFGNGDPCNTRLTESVCTAECSTGPLSSTCSCYWDDPSNPSGFPMDTGNGANSNCTPDTPCCWNRPCSTFGSLDQCNLGGGGTDTVPDRCTFTNGACQCTLPLIPVPYTAFPTMTSTLQVYAPFDCLCPVDGSSNTSSVAQCQALLVPSKEQKRQVQRFDFRVAKAIGDFNHDQYVQKCKVDKVCITLPNGHKRGNGNSWGSFADAARKIAQQLAKHRCDSDVEDDGDNKWCVRTLPGCGSSAVQFGHNVLSEDQLQQIDPLVVESVTPSSAAFTTLSTALTAALVVARLL